MNTPRMGRANQITKYRNGYLRLPDQLYIKSRMFTCTTLYQITIAYIRRVMLAILLIGRANLNNSFEIKVSQLYNAVPWQVTYKTDDILQNGVFLSFDSNQCTQYLQND